MTKSKLSWSKRLLSLTAAAAMAVSLGAAGVNAQEPAEKAGMEPGTYEVSITSLESAAPLPAVQTAFAQAMGDTVELTVAEDGTATVTADLQHMVIDMMGSYHANVTVVKDATVLETRQDVYSSTFGAPDTYVDIEVPSKVQFAWNDLSADSQVLTINVDFMNAFLGGGNPYDTKVTLTLDLENAVADTSQLAALVEEYAQVTADGYTEESYQALQDALAQANALLEGNPTMADINAMMESLEAAYAGLTEAPAEEPQQPGALDKDNLADGTYQVKVALWHADKDQASMAASSLLEDARIVVKDGVYTMYLYTQPMTIGAITASLQELQVADDAGNYTDGTVESRDGDGNPTSFSFVMPHTNEYINVKVNPMVAIMGNQALDARIKVDYSTLAVAEGEVVIPTTPEQSQPSDPTTSSTPETSQPAGEENPKTGDQAAPIALAVVMVLAAGGMAALAVKKRREG